MFWIKFCLRILLCLQKDIYIVIKIIKPGDWTGGERLKKTPTFMFVVQAGGAGGLLDLPDDISHTFVWTDTETDWAGVGVQ